MAMKNSLKDAAVKIGSAADMVDGTAHKTARKAAAAVRVAKLELIEVPK
jgi:hypothetical protein